MKILIQWLAVLVAAAMTVVAVAKEATSSWQLSTAEDGSTVSAIAQVNLTVRQRQSILISVGCFKGNLVFIYNTSLFLMPRATVSLMMFGNDADGEMQSHRVEMTPESDGTLGLEKEAAKKVALFIAALGKGGAGLYVRSAASDESYPGFIPGLGKESIQAVFQACGERMM